MGMSGDSGEKLNIELNLVPFIDLLSSLVLFLLLTAVWVQVSTINSQIEKKGSAASSAKKEDSQLSIRLTPMGFSLTWPAKLSILPSEITKSRGQFDYPALEARIKEGRQKFPEITASVNADDEVDYGEVIRTIDTGKQSGLATVGIEAG